MSVVVDALGLVALLAVVLNGAGRADAFVEVALPLTAGAAAVAVVVTLVLRYPPIPRPVRAAIACGVGAVVAVTAQPFVDVVLTGRPFALATADLGVWSPVTLNGNVPLLTAAGFGAASLLLLALSAASARRKRAQRVA